jgi:Putative peptidoglycan binding domain
MKRIVFLTCIGSLGLALTALGAPKGNKGGPGSARGGGARSAHVVSRGGGHATSMRTARSLSGTRSHQHAVAASSRARSNSFAHTRTSRSNHVQAARAQSTRIAHNRTAANARNRAAVNRERNLAQANTASTNQREAARLRNQRTAQANARINSRRNLEANRGRNMTLGRNVAINGNRENARVVNNWRNDRFRGSRYAAFYNYNRQWHDRGWWRNHYSHVVFVIGGWWYWNAGYWYPAWGYDQSSYYPYDGPIYGYGNLTPGRIVVNVQVALQRDGYYTGPIDGSIGPQTREALATFQADNNLAVTSAVDGPTLQTLGLA